MTRWRRRAWLQPNNVDTDLVDGKALLGHRVPALVVSPFSMGKPATPRIDSHLYDHTSVLKLIEWRHGLAPLALRDASDDVANLALALDLGGGICCASVDPGCGSRLSLRRRDCLSWEARSTTRAMTFISC